MRIQIYTTAWCGFCERAKALLDERGIPYEEIRVDNDPAFRAKLLDLTGRWTVPQIVIDGNPWAATSSSVSSTGAASWTSWRPSRPETGARPGT